jgi:hypothetical protein
MKEEGSEQATEFHQQRFHTKWRAIEICPEAVRDEREWSCERIQLEMMRSNDTAWMA